MAVQLIATVDGDVYISTFVVETRIKFVASPHLMVSESDTY